MGRRFNLNKKILFLIFVIFSSIVVLVAKGIKVNATYPSAREEHVAIGKSATLQKDISFKVKKVQWMSNQEFVKKYGENPDVNKEEESKVVLVNVLVQNNKKKSVNVDFSRIYFERFGYSNGLCMDSTLELGGSTGVKIKPGQEKETLLVYSMNQFQFSKTQWKQIEHTKNYLIRDWYPVKRCWDL
ncbi:MAG: hypothetical protein PHD56_00715 [Anaerostipes sp.]|nr:hypothetical protein [Anaerostipes sp.]